jgi:hypothetical protein
VRLDQPSTRLLQRKPDQALKGGKPAPWPEITPESLTMLGIGVALGVAGVLVAALFTKLLSGDRAQ